MISGQCLFTKFLSQLNVNCTCRFIAYKWPLCFLSIGQGQNNSRKTKLLHKLVDLFKLVYL